MVNKIIEFINEKIIIIIGFFFGILAISIGISIIMDSKQYSDELNFGNYKFSESINVVDNSNNFSASEDIKNLIGDNYKNSLITYSAGLYRMEGVPASDAGYILPLAYNKIRWLPNIIYGRHLTDEETLSNEKLAVIGIDMFKRLGLTKLDDKAKINIDNKEFKIIGVMGREKRFIDENKMIFIPYKNFIKPSTYDNFSPLMIHSDKENPNNLIEKIKNIKEIQLIPSEKPEKQISDIEVSYKLIIIIGILILVLTSINMSTTCMFWVYKRKREFAIRKAIGATDMKIAVLILKEIFQVALIGCILAFLFQISFRKILEDFTVNMELNFGLENLVIGLIVVGILSIVSSFIPIRKSINMDISQEIK